MIEQLMERANTALHAAKSGGGNRAQVAFSATARPAPKTVEGTSTRG
jgi:predicted signal transduction protein with EAL and GGDEF domain